MAAFAGPEISNSGLVLHLDAANIRSYDGYENLALNSEAINLWGSNGNSISIAANAEIAPDGTLTAEILSQTAVVGATRWTSSIGNRTYTAGVTYTLSIWLKKVSGTDGQPTINLWVNNGTNQSVGTITTSWVRYSATFTPATTISSNTFTGLNIAWSDQGVANNFTFAAWGFQLEIGPKATTYYQTTSTPKTRGTILTDLSGNGNNATLINGPVFSNDNGGGIIFDGTNDQISIANSVSLQNTFSTGSFTIVSFSKATDVVYPKSVFPFYIETYVLNNTWAIANRGMSSGDGANDTAFAIEVNNSGTYFVGSVNHTVTTSTVYHRAIVIDRSNGFKFKYYVNGIFLGETESTSITGSIYNSGGMVFGNMYGWTFKGSLFNFMIYSKILNDAEILQNFEALRWRYGI